MSAQELSNYPYYKVTVETPDGLECVDLHLFDTTVDMVKHITRIFQDIETIERFKKFTTVKIKRM